MSNFGSVGFNVSNAGRAHLALIEGGGAADTTGSARDATRTLGAAPIALVAADTTRRAAATGYASTSPEAPRSRHEAGIRAVAQQFDEFHEALLPMVLASGVAGVAAASIVEAIMSNPVLKAQAQRAFDKAREATA